MDKHLIVLGVLFLALGIMGLIGMAAVFLVFSIGSAAITTAAAQEPDVPALLALLPAGLGLFVCAAIAISALPSVIAGVGCLLKRPWVRVWILIAGVLNLPGFPLGTGVGIYAIWVFLQDDTQKALTG